MDKDLFKSVMRDKGVPVARSVTLRRPRDASRPVRLPGASSSRPGSARASGSRSSGGGGAPAAVELAFAHDEKILLEEFVDGVEVECSVLGNDEPIASVPGEIVPLASDWYDY